MHAKLTNYRQSPRKVRLVANLIKGTTVHRANILLDHTPKRATAQIKKLLASAVANARQEGSVDEHELIVKDIRVDDGITMKRFRPVSRGRAHPINKRTSNITLVLGKTKVKKQEAGIKNQGKKKKSPALDS